jgi:hypothetical protein
MSHLPLPAWMCYLTSKKRNISNKRVKSILCQTRLVMTSWALPVDISYNKEGEPDHIVFFCFPFFFFFLLTRATFFFLSSFYPVFPVPFDVLHEINFDVTHSDLLRLDIEAGLDYAPDVFISPSKLRHFAKVWSPRAINRMLKRKTLSYRSYKTRRSSILRF